VVLTVDVEIVIVVDELLVIVVVEVGDMEDVEVEDKEVEEIDVEEIEVDETDVEDRDVEESIVVDETEVEETVVEAAVVLDTSVVLDRLMVVVDELIFTVVVLCTVLCAIVLTAGASAINPKAAISTQIYRRQSRLINKPDLIYQFRYLTFNIYSEPPQKHRCHRSQA